MSQLISTIPSKATQTLVPLFHQAVHTSLIEVKIEPISNIVRTEIFEEKQPSSMLFLAEQILENYMAKHT